MNDNKKIYTMLELTYIKSFNSEEIFPNNWYNIKDRSFKIKVLNEALKKNLLIIDTETFTNFTHNH